MEASNVLLIVLIIEFSPDIHNCCTDDIHPKGGQTISSNSTILSWSSPFFHQDCHLSLPFFDCWSEAIFLSFPTKHLMYKHFYWALGLDVKIMTFPFIGPMTSIILHKKIFSYIVSSTMTWVLPKLQNLQAITMLRHIGALLLHYINCLVLSTVVYYQTLSDSNHLVLQLTLQQKQQGIINSSIGDKKTTYHSPAGFLRW